MSGPEGAFFAACGTGSGWEENVPNRYLIIILGGVPAGMSTSMAPSLAPNSSNRRSPSEQSLLVPDQPESAPVVAASKPDSYTSIKINSICYVIISNIY